MCQVPKHDPDHGNINPSLFPAREYFIAFRESAPSGKPSKRALNDPVPFWDVMVDAFNNRWITILEQGSREMLATALAAITSTIRVVALLETLVPHPEQPTGGLGWLGLLGG